MMAKLLLERLLLLLYLSTVIDAQGTCECSMQASSEGTAPTDCSEVLDDPSCEVGFHCECNYQSVFYAGRAFWCMSDPICVQGNQPAPVPAPVPTAPFCAPGTNMCMDPHLSGLRGQRIDVSGEDGGWYCLVKDDEIDLHVNLRFTAPLPHEFPERQLITGFAILTNGHSLVIEVRNPHSIKTDGCLEGSSPCLADGGLRLIVDGQEMADLLRPTRDTWVLEDIEISSYNLPAECRQFGGDRIWTRMFEEMQQGRRKLVHESFEDWILRFDHMAAPDWCAKYISERGLDHVQSNHAIFRIVTPTVVVRLLAGINNQQGGNLNWDGRVLPELDFWQMEVGFEGLVLEHTKLTGLLGETARPVFDDQGHALMRGHDALRGTVEDYRVTDATAIDFALLRF